MKGTAFLELGVSRSKPKLVSWMIVGLLSGANGTAVYAGPTGSNIVAGQALISQSGLNTTIDQSSNRVAIDW